MASPKFGRSDFGALLFFVNISMETQKANNENTPYSNNINSDLCVYTPKLGRLIYHPAVIFYKQSDGILAN